MTKFPLLVLSILVSTNLYAKYLDQAKLHEDASSSNFNRQPSSTMSPGYTNPGLPSTGPIRVGGSIDDACGGGGHLPANAYFYYRQKYKTQGGVTFGPPAIMLLGAGTTVYMCGQVGAYTRVVIPNNQVDCGVSTPIAKRQVYTGPCWSGWIETVRMIQDAG